MTEGNPIGPHKRQPENIEKLDNVTWFGHCAIHVAAALRDLSSREAKLQLIQNLWSYLGRQKREIERRKSGCSVNGARRHRAA
jgi:hypothetical protein